MSGEYAYVTGGASGIGRAVAQMLVKHKYAISNPLQPGLTNLT